MTKLINLPAAVVEEMAEGVVIAYAARSKVWRSIAISLVGRSRCRWQIRWSGTYGRLGG
jgi:hypothetical protein